MMSRGVEKLLLECIRLNPKADFKIAVMYFFGDDHDIDWPIILGPGFKIFLPVYLEAKALSKDFKLPEQIEEAVKFQYMETVARNEEIKKAVIGLAEEFQRDGIDLIFLKGAALIMTIYSDDVGIRPMADIDVLVRDDTLSKAENILRRIGYAEDYGRFEGNVSRDFLAKHHFHYIYFKDNIRLELHWDIVYKSNPAVLKKMFDLSEKSLASGAKIRVLNSECSIFMACINFSRTPDASFPWAESQDDKRIRQYRSLFFLFEIKKMLQQWKNRILWDNLLFLARSAGNEYEVFTLLFLAQKIVKADIPEVVIKKMKRKHSVNFYIHLCRNIEYDDFKKLFFARGLIRKPFKSFRDLYLFIMTYLYLYNARYFFIIRRIVRGIKRAI